MSRTVVPLHERNIRIPEAGRIRLGIKSGKAMRSINTFRFTSSTRYLIDQLAELYNGKVEPMDDPKSSHKWQVITTAKTIDIYLPHNAFSTWYELWEGSGRQRQCDGETVEVPIKTGDGWEPQPKPCICHAQGSLTCRPVTRLNVIIPGIDFAGVWRLETKGWNAQAELPGMIDIITSMNKAGQLVKAGLAIQERQQMTPAGKRNFIVPMLTLPYTPEEILSGMAGVTAIASAAQPVEIRALAPVEEDIIDIELVDDPILDRLYEVCAQMQINYDRLAPAMFTQLGAGIPGQCVLTDEQQVRLLSAIGRIESGELTFVGFNTNGTIIWKVGT
jgi:hypothetical protein